MKIAILGYGVEGKSTEVYFKKKGAKIDIFSDFTFNEISKKDFSAYDLVFRSPSVPPLFNSPNLSSATRYFFDHCPCPIIGVTATKGKGTTCSFIKSLLDAHGHDVRLVGNIGTPALDVLDALTPDSVVVYELSSFQLWDLKTSPHVAVLGTIEPDHLNVHRDFDDYISAKSHITNFQTANDYLIYFAENPETFKLAESSPAGVKISFPFAAPAEVKTAIKLPGEHNLNNALAAIAAVASLKNLSPDAYLAANLSTVVAGLSKTRGLPHRLEFLRELNGVRYFDDNFSTGISSTRVAINAFPNGNLVLIAGGRDKTGDLDLPEIVEALQAPQVKKVILIGESGHQIYDRFADARFTLAESLEEAVLKARLVAESLVKSGDEDVIVLMSPAAASFDMFKNVYDRGDQFKSLVSSLAPQS